MPETVLAVVRTVALPTTEGHHGVSERRGRIIAMLGKQHFRVTPVQADTFDWDTNKFTVIVSRQKLSIAPGYNRDENSKLPRSVDGKTPIVPICGEARNVLAVPPSAIIFIAACF